MAVHGVIFSPSGKIRFRVVAKPENIQHEIYEPQFYINVDTLFYLKLFYPSYIYRHLIIHIYNRGTGATTSPIRRSYVFPL
jgi:hypothetical protein